MPEEGDMADIGVAESTAWVGFHSASTHRETHRQASLLAVNFL
jgi:hypothetical protein